MSKNVNTVSACKGGVLSSKILGTIICSGTIIKIKILEKPHHEKPHENVNHEKPVKHKEILPPKEKSPIPDKVPEHEIKPDSDEINVEKEIENVLDEIHKMKEELEIEKDKEIEKEQIAAHDDFIKVRISVTANFFIKDFFQ